MLKQEIGESARKKFIILENAWRITRQKEANNNLICKMVLGSASEIVATAAASFFLGWTLKHFHFNWKLLNFKSVPPIMKTKMVIVVRSDLSMTKGEI